MICMKRKSLEEDWCPVARALDAVGDRWSLLILRDAFLGKRRFGEFQASLGVARNVLTTRLRKLVAHEILEVVPASDGSAYQEYALTAKGQDLYLVLVALRQWGERWLFPNEPQTSRLVDAVHGLPVAPLELKACNGRPLGPSDFQVKMVPSP
jgi:DNA-binding HxlR family transcriptional regulator